MPLRRELCAERQTKDSQNSSSLAFLLLAWHATLEVSGPSTSRCAELPLLAKRSLCDAKNFRRILARVSVATGRQVGTRPFSDVLSVRGIRNSRHDARASGPLALGGNVGAAVWGGGSTALQGETGWSVRPPKSSDGCSYMTGASSINSVYGTVADDTFLIPPRVLAIRLLLEIPRYRQKLTVIRSWARNGAARRRSFRTTRLRARHSVPLAISRASVRPRASHPGTDRNQIHQASRSKPAAFLATNESPFAE